MSEPAASADHSSIELERRSWLAQLPQAIVDLKARWALSIGSPWVDTGSCSWVAPATRNGQSLVLKLGLPHMEARDEIAGLHYWNGDPTVRLVESDLALNALLLERCEPGRSLRERPEPEQDVVVAGLLQRAWRRPPRGHSFRPLSVMLEAWAAEARDARARWCDAGLVEAGLALFTTLGRGEESDVLLTTDLHAGNVLSAAREPWLLIDPKPFVGDPTYDATQHLLNCLPRLRNTPRETIRRVADLCGLEHERLRLWTFARLAAEASRATATEFRLLARALA